MLRFKALSIALLLTLFVWGCTQADDNTQGTVTQEEVELDLSQFGLSVADPVAEPNGKDLEQETLNKLEGLFPDNEKTDDPEFSTIDPMPTPDRKVYFIKIKFGQLRGNPGNKVGVDWSGAVYSNVATVRIVRLIKFDKNDYIVRPRTDEHGFKFVAKTLPHYDGFLLMLVQKASVLDVVPSLTFESKAYKTTIALQDIPGLNRLEKIDQAGNAIVFLGMERHADCAKGFLSGKWFKVGEKGGVFYGRASSFDGDKEAFLVGVYSDGAFKGIWFNRDRTNRGVLRGTYKDGEFKGEWKSTRFADGHGEMRGKYADNRFRGLWKRDCKDDDAPTTKPDVTVEPVDGSTATDSSGI